ncbi:unnamed protein product, partial [Cyprideis torosa]
MSAVFHRHCHVQPPLAQRGEGPYIIDKQGKRYLDACGGAAVSCLGHNNPEVIAAMKAQLDRIAFAHTGFFSSEPAEALADFLVQRAPTGLEKVYFVSGGSEAIETALKLARQYFLECGEPQRKLFVTRRQSYHGNTLGALSVGGNFWRRDPFAPIMTNGHHIAPCYAYRDQLPNESAQDYGQRVADELEEKLQQLGPKNVLAFIAEPVVGATAGAVPPVAGYFRRIREICDRHGVLLILDEVMCGMGRTGTLFACEQEGIVPDMIATAKGLGAGYQPIGALLTQQKIWDAIAQGSGFFQHGHTYMAHPLACAAALAVQQIIEQQDLLKRVHQHCNYLFEQLHARFDSHPHVGDIRGRGLFIGLEFVAERNSKTPFPTTVTLDKVLKKTAMENGLMCYPMA